MKITVTRNDIKRGRRESETSCPIAHSLKRQGWKDVKVGDEIIGRPPGFKSTLTFDTSEKVNGFIGEFDDQGAAGVKPFSFDL